MSRANSLKKAVRQIIEHTERVLDEQTVEGSVQALLTPPQIKLHSDDENSEPIQPKVRFVISYICVFWTVLNWE